MDGIDPALVLIAPQGPSSTKSVVDERIGLLQT
jgi:hypothetical protein